jgi:glycosyltransferase involved in cell wall biosynthesis
MSPPAPLVASPLLSVVICTHDRVSSLAACLRSLPRRGWLDIIVVDSGSEAKAAREIGRLAAREGVRLLRQTTPGLSIARNHGLAAARAEWVAFLDDDVRAALGWAEAMLEGTSSLPPLAAAAGGPIRPLPGQQIPIWWPAELRPCLSLIDCQGFGRIGDGNLPADLTVFGANIVFRAVALRAIGGFPERLGRNGRSLASGEETFTLHRLRNCGQQIHFLPQAAVAHVIEPERLTPGWLIARQFSSGASEAQMLELLAEGERARSKARRLAFRAVLLAPLALWPRRGARLLRMRCRLAFAWGFLNGYRA